MYVSIDGSLVYSDTRKIQDTFDINFLLDINDIPFGKIGMTQSLSKSNQAAMKESLRLIIADMLNNNPGLQNVSIEKILIDANNLNKFLVVANINGSYVNIPIGDK